MKQKISAGLIGYGLAGRVFHAPLITSVDGFEIKKITTSDPAKAEAIREKYPAAEITTFQEVISSPVIDLVIIASPNEFHFDQAKQALLADKHVVIDKPFSITTKEADELIAIGKSTNKIITAFQNRRWDGDFLTVQKIINSKQLGNIVEAEIHYDRFRNYIKPDTWKEEDRPGGGIIYDLGSHIIDQAQVLFGMPEAVTAIIISQRKGGRTADNFELVLHYPDLKVTIKAGMLVRARLPRYIILGDAGSFVKYGLDVQEAQLNAGMKPGDALYGKEDPAEHGELRIDIDSEKFETHIIPTEQGKYLQFYQNIYESIAEGKPLYVKPEEARNNVRLIELAIQSASENRTIFLQ